MKHIQKDELIKTLILAGFSIWLIYLLQTSNIDLYISPNLTWLSKLSAILLIILTFATIIPSKHGSKYSCCEHHRGSCTLEHGHFHTLEHKHLHSSEDEHSHSTLSLAKVLIFCVPLLLGFAVKPQLLDSKTLANSINTAGTLPFYVTQFAPPKQPESTVQWPNWQSLASRITGKEPSSTLMVNNSTTLSTKPRNNHLSNDPVKPVNSTVKETDLVQLALTDHPDQIYNQSYRLTGFVYKDPRLTKNQFVITRFVITCCIVDAQPIGIIAESPDAATLKADSWLEVEGVLKNRSIIDSDKIKPVYNFQAAENTAPYFVVTKFKKISTPKDPYLTVTQ